ncbi:unnamed protein product [Closterium sp. Naga37s-1]|nr:unnamed protein product [Closterium sp. Naga37s-1]
MLQTINRVFTHSTSFKRRGKGDNENSGDKSPLSGKDSAAGDQRPDSPIRLGSPSIAALGESTLKKIVKRSFYGDTSVEPLVDGRGGTGKEVPTEMLAFEIGAIMRRTLEICDSMSEKMLSSLRANLQAPGVVTLISSDLRVLWGLAGYEKHQELRSVACRVAVLGRKCRESRLHRLERLFARLDSTDADYKMFAASSAEGEVLLRFMREQAEATSELKSEMESIQELHSRIQEYGEWNSLQDMVTQGKLVEKLQGHCLWAYHLDFLVQLLIIAACYVRKKIFAAFGHGMCPPRIREACVGEAGLALHYANVVVLLERIIQQPDEVLGPTRDELYEMLPRNIQYLLRVQLQDALNFQADGRVEANLKRGLLLLPTMAHNTITWHSLHTPGAALDSSEAVFQVQTFYFANLQAVNATLVDVLLGLCRICGVESPIGCVSTQVPASLDYTQLVAEKVAEAERQFRKACGMDERDEDWFGGEVTKVHDDSCQARRAQTPRGGEAAPVASAVSVVSAASDVEGGRSGSAGGGGGVNGGSDGTGSPAFVTPPESPASAVSLPSAIPVSRSEGGGVERKGGAGRRERGRTDGRDGEEQSQSLEERGGMKAGREEELGEAEQCGKSRTGGGRAKKSSQGAASSSSGRVRSRSKLQQENELPRAQTAPTAETTAVTSVHNGRDSGGDCGGSNTSGINSTSGTESPFRVPSRPSSGRPTRSRPSSSRFKGSDASGSAAGAGAAVGPSDSSSSSPSRLPTPPPPATYSRPRIPSSRSDNSFLQQQGGGGRRGKESMRNSGGGVCKSQSCSPQADRLVVASCASSSPGRPSPGRLSPSDASPSRASPGRGSPRQASGCFSPQGLPFLSPAGTPSPADSPRSSRLGRGEARGDVGGGLGEKEASGGGRGAREATGEGLDETRAMRDRLGDGEQEREAQGEAGLEGATGEARKRSSKSCSWGSQRWGFSKSRSMRVTTAPPATPPRPSTPPASSFSSDLMLAAGVTDWDTESPAVARVDGSLSLDHSLSSSLLSPSLLETRRLRKAMQGGAIVGCFTGGGAAAAMDSESEAEGGRRGGGGSRCEDCELNK